jgi:hypothetical protein
MSDTPRTDALEDRCFEQRTDIDEIFVHARQLERELAEAKKDAERYRWLRDNSYNVQIGVYEMVERDGRQQRAWLAGNELDDVIDAAMKEGK